MGLSESMENDLKTMVIMTEEATARWVEAHSVLLRARLAADQVRSQAQVDVRTVLQASGAKTTEAAVEAQVSTQAKVIETEKALLEAEIATHVARASLDMALNRVELAKIVLRVED